MIFLILLFIALIASAWLGGFIQHDPGYVLITFHHWTIESTLAGAIIILVLTSLALYILFKFIHFNTRLPHRVGNKISAHLTEKQRLKEKAQQTLRSKQLAEALEHFHNKHWEALLELLPSLRKQNLTSTEVIDAMERKARLAILTQARNGSPKEAAAVWKKCRPQDRNDPDFLSQHFLNLLAHDRLKPEKWLKDFPDHPTLHLCAGLAYKEQAIWGKAKQSLTKSLELLPSRDAWRHLGDIHQQLGDNASAIECYQRALDSASISQHTGEGEHGQPDQRVSS